MSRVVIDNSQRNPGCLIQVLWFVFIGWWFGQLWIAVAWILMLTIVGIPLGVAMMNKVPWVIALRGESEALRVATAGGVTMVSRTQVPQYNLVLRALWFLLVGWWLSAAWMEVAYFFCLTIIGLPLGFWMFDRVPALVSLRRG
jgi:uncharacterized membrane protein YccF (DUF307 family)